MNFLLAPFIALAALGLILSLFVHVCSLVGVSTPLAEHAWGLHIGIFVVWLPAVVAANRLVRNVKPRDYWRAVLRGCPPWLRGMVYVFFAYAMVNFLLFLAATFAEPLAGSSGSGTPPAVFRGFSGHWMAFYSAALGILYSAMRAGERGVESRCPKGHPVSPFARFCEECGERLIPEDHVDSSNGSA